MIICYDSVNSCAVSKLCKVLIKGIKNLKGQMKLSNPSHDDALGLESIAERAGLDATDLGPQPVQKQKQAGANSDKASRREQEI